MVNKDRLEGLDYAYLIQYASQKFNSCTLGKDCIMQMLYFLYGFYYAKTGKLLFDDDKPRAYPLGVYFKKINFMSEIDGLVNFSNKKILEFNENVVALEMTKELVKRFKNYDVYYILKIVKEKSGPWFMTLYGDYINGGKQKEWGSEIDKKIIKNYFKAI